MFLRRFMYQREGKITREMAQHQPRLGATTWCMSRYTQSSGTIHERYTNLVKGNKHEGLILVGEINRIFKRMGMEVTVYYFFHGYFVGVEFLA